jgi:hypothetical protein
MRIYAFPYPRRDPMAARALHLCGDHDLVPIEDRHVNGHPSGGYQRAQQRGRLVAQHDSFEGDVGDAHELQPAHVTARGVVALKVSFPLERHEQAVDGALREVEMAGEL